jgi:hypothetical protein
MNNRCTVCSHPQRIEIEAAHVGGVSFREIGKRFGGKSKTTIARHVRLHVPNAAQMAIEAANGREVESGTSVLDDLRAISDKASTLLEQAEAAKDGRLAIAALRELARHVELRARIRASCATGRSPSPTCRLTP